MACHLNRLLLLVSVIAGWSTSSTSSHAETSPAPKLVELSRIEAIAKLNFEGYEYEVKILDEKCKEPDVVVAQFPEADVPVEAGAEFIIYINTLDEDIVVPKFVGQEFSATGALASAACVSRSIRAKKRAHAYVEPIPYGFYVCEDSFKFLKYHSTKIDEQSIQPDNVVEKNTNIILFRHATYYYMWEIIRQPPEECP